MQLTGIDYFIVLLYMTGIVLLGLYFTRYSKSTSGYFLAGRMLPFWAIAMSIVGSDIGVTEFVGLSGQGYRFGIQSVFYVTDLLFHFAIQAGHYRLVEFIHVDPASRKFEGIGVAAAGFSAETQDCAFSILEDELQRQLIEIFFRGHRIQGSRITS